MRLASRASSSRAPARGGGAVEALRHGAQRAEIAVDEAGVEFAVAEFIRAAERGEKSGIAARAERRRSCRAQSASWSSACSRVCAVRDQLGDHRIVERRDLVAGLDAGVDAQALALRKFQRNQLAGRRQKAALGILGVKPRLDGVTVERHLDLA